MAVVQVVNQSINQSIMTHLLHKIPSKCVSKCFCIIKWKPIDPLEKPEMTATRKDFPVGRELKQSSTFVCFVNVCGVVGWKNRNKKNTTFSALCRFSGKFQQKSSVSKKKMMVIIIWELALVGPGSKPGPG